MHTVMLGFSQRKRMCTKNHYTCVLHQWLLENKGLSQILDRTSFKNNPLVIIKRFFLKSGIKISVGIFKFLFSFLSLLMFRYLCPLRTSDTIPVAA